MKESGQLAADPPLGDVVAEAVEDPPGQSAVGSVDRSGSPVGVNTRTRPPGWVTRIISVSARIGLCRC